MIYFIKIMERFSNNAVHIIEVSGDKRKTEKVYDGVGIVLDHDEYYTVIEQQQAQEL